MDTGAWEPGQTEGVMVNFRCQLDWIMGCLHTYRNIILECVQERSADSVQVILPSVGGHHPVHWGMSGTERQRRGHPLSAWLKELRHQSFALGVGLMADIVGTPASQTFRLGLELTPLALLDWPPVCRWQIVGFFSLHNHRSQFIFRLLFKNVYILWVIIKLVFVSMQFIFKF